MGEVITGAVGVLDGTPVALEVPSAEAATDNLPGFSEAALILPGLAKAVETAADPSNKTNEAAFSSYPR